MAGYSNPSLLEMADGYQFGGRVRGRGGRGRPPTPPGPPQMMTAGAYTGAPPSPTAGGTSTMGQGGFSTGPPQGMGASPVGAPQPIITPPVGDGATQAGGTTPPVGGYAPGTYGTTAGIAEEFGFDPEQYSEYFTAISPEMQAATQEATYDPYFKEQIGQLREQRGGQVAGLRQNLLQSVMQAEQAGAGSGFAGGAPGGQRMLDLTRAGAETQYGDIGAAYGRGKYGVKEAISGRISGGRQAIEAAKRANIATASRLYQAGAGDLGGGSGMTASQEQWSQSGQFGASATGSTQGYIDPTTGVWTEPDTGVVEATQVGGEMGPGGAEGTSAIVGGAVTAPVVTPNLTGFAYGGPVSQRNPLDYLMARRFGG